MIPAESLYDGGIMIPDTQCKIEFHVIDRLCQPLSCEHFELEAKHIKYYFVGYGITIRLPEWLAKWLSMRCNYIRLALDDCRIIMHWNDVDW